MSKDRAIGALFGLSVGDALGTSIEFSIRDTYEPLTDIIGGGPFNLQPGQWTDDTSMALCLADSLIECQALDVQDLMEKFAAWYTKGYNSCTGSCFDIGFTTRRTIAAFRVNGNPMAGSPDPQHSGNGSIMRLSPSVIFNHSDYEEAIADAILQGKTTHASDDCNRCSEELAKILFNAINGKPKSELFDVDYSKIDRNDIKSSGYVVHTFEAACWSVYNTNSFKDAVLLAANLGDDADTVGAVAGQIAGAIYGLSGIPVEWIKKIAWSDHIVKLGTELYDHGLRASQ